MKTTTTQIVTETTEDIMNEAQATKFLHQTNPRTLRSWRMKRGLPHFKPSSRVILYSKKAIAEWLEKSRA